MRHCQNHNIAGPLLGDFHSSFTSRVWLDKNKEIGTGTHIIVVRLRFGGIISVVHTRYGTTLCNHNNGTTKKVHILGEKL